MRESALVLALAATPVLAAPDFEVSGIVVPTEDALEVRVDVRNTGDAPAAPLTVAGELFGERREARLEGGLAPGQSGSVPLSFPLHVPRPGVHALPLLLEYPVDGPRDAAGNPPMASRRAYLLLALGGTAEPAVRLDVSPLRLDVRGDLAVGLESADGEPHRVRLRVFTARGVRPDASPFEVDVPARGRVASAVPLIRAGAPRGTPHWVLVVAEGTDGPLARTTVATALVEVTPDPALLPGLRRPLAVLAVLLLAAAVVLEVRRARAARARSPGPAA